MDARGVRETKLRDAVMAALLHLNSGNTGMALQALHQAIITFDDFVKADFAAQDAIIERGRARARELQAAVERRERRSKKRRKK